MSVANKAMIVSLHQRIWQAASADRTIASGVEAQHNAQYKTMRVVKQLAPREKLLPIRRVAEIGDHHHKTVTLPGLMDGQRLLATRIFDEYASHQAEIKEAFYAEVNSFRNVYPEIIEMAPKRLGKAFRASDFPKVEAIVSYFSYEHRFQPVPEGANWYLDDVTTDAMSKLRNEVENEKNDLFREASKSLVERTKSVLENLFSQIITFDPDVPSGKLREATINSVKEMAGLIPLMNITEDPTIAAVGADMIKHFQSVDAADMRKDKDTRDRIANLTKGILARMQ